MTGHGPADVIDFLVARGLARADEILRCLPLPGGVSSEIWRAELRGRNICVKRALAKLRVVDQWFAPLSRNAYEWEWLCFAHQHLPGAVPEPLAHDSERGLFAMSFLEADQFPSWKKQLMQGNVNPVTAEQVGATLGHLHEISANIPGLLEKFDSQANFYALRLEPYLIATACRHPDLAAALRDLATRTASVRTALVHGDVSPKNILVGLDGPVLLDAECAWFGDPAFDLAFAINHLLLKVLIRPDRRETLFRSVDRLADAYFDEVIFEARSVIERRTAKLLPALMLARVDGKSPVEYLATDELK